MAVTDLWISPLSPTTASARARRSSLAWLAWFSALMGLAGLVGLLLLRRGPNPALIAWLVYLLGAAAILYRPRYGIYLTLFFGLLADMLLLPWYPFVKNFSSRESILFLHDSLIISPLEGYLLLTFFAWFLGNTLKRKLRVFTGPLFWPAAAFLAFVILGTLYGIGTGGNLTIALWEARPLFYLVMMLFLASNLLETRQHTSNLIWAAMIGLFAKGLSGNIYFFSTLKGSLESVDRITEHAAAVQMNTVFIFTLLVWLYKASPAKKITLPIMIPFVALTYLATQRRAAFVTLALALAVFAVLLFLENRRAFWLLVPPMTVLALAYLAIFWNSSGTIGLPAQAIKSVVAPDQANAEDQSSNLYRIIENINTGFTIHQKPLTGVGFGQKFYIVAYLPDISFFEWWQYLPHNSIIWIWLKMGVGGFVTMLFFVGYAIMTGARVAWRMPRNDLRAIAFTATFYFVMHFLYAYVDISWDTQSMVYVGAMMGMVNCLERIVAQPVTIPAKRWRWQPDPMPVSGLLND